MKGHFKYIISYTVTNLRNFLQILLGHIIKTGNLPPPFEKCLDDDLCIFIVAFFENASLEDSLESLCVCVCARGHVCVCVFCTITQKEIDLGT